MEGYYTSNAGKIEKVSWELSPLCMQVGCRLDVIKYSKSQGFGTRAFE